MILKLKYTPTKKKTFNLYIRLSSRTMLKSVKIFNTSYVTYEFKCQWEAGYIGRTNQLLGKRIIRHMPATRNGWLHSLHKCAVTSVSATTEHLINNRMCAVSFREDELNSVFCYFIILSPHLRFSFSFTLYSILPLNGIIIGVKLFFKSLILC